MTLLYVWVLILLVPLYLLYRVELQRIDQEVLVVKTQMAKRQLQLLFLVLAFILVAFSRPVITTTKVDQKFDSQEFIVAIDASFSMQADDLKPTRYDVAKAAIKKLLHARNRDRFSLYAFTSNALLISPPTTDTAITLMALDALDPKNILTKSTNLKALLETIGRSKHKAKKLIIFTDGGEEHNVNKLLSICKENAIIPYIVATGSARGASLRKDGKLLKDQYASLVISRINPILKELARLAGGEYYALDSNDLSVIDALVSDLAQGKSEEATVSVKSYLDLYFLPLFIAIILFVFAVTNLHQRILLLLFALVLSPDRVEAALFDFYHLDQAQQYYKEDAFDTAAKSFEKVTPSTISYYNIAVAYYKAGNYKDAMKYFGAIETRDKALKQRIYYGMGNCAVRLEQYDRAMTYYRQALSLGEDIDARYNLRLLQKLHLSSKVNIADMLPQKDPVTKKSSSKTTETSQDDKKEGESSSRSNQQSNQSSAGSGDATKGKTEKTKSDPNSSPSKADYKVGYKLYELINKGYTDEKEPW